MDFIDKLDQEQQQNAIKIADEAVKMGINPRLAVALAYQESGLRQDRVGGAGEIGIMQVKPTTAEMIGFSRKDLENTDSNIKAGLTYLKQGIEKLGDPVLAAAGYNAGMDHPYFGDPKKGLPESTMNYVRSIKDLGGFTEPPKAEEPESSKVEVSDEDLAAMKARIMMDVGAAGAGAAVGKAGAFGKGIADTAAAVRDLAMASRPPPGAVGAPTLPGAPMAPPAGGLPPAQGPLANAPAGGRMTQNWVRSQDAAGAYELEAQKARDLKEAHQMKRAAMAAEDKIRAIAPEMRQVPERAGLFLPENVGAGPRGAPNVPIPPVQPPAAPPPPGALQQMGAGLRGAAGAMMRSPVVTGALGGVGAAEMGMESMGRMKQQDPIGSAIAGAGAIGSGMAMMPHPAAKVVGAGLGIASPLALYLYDKMRTTSPEAAQRMLSNVDIMGAPMP